MYSPARTRFQMLVMAPHWSMRRRRLLAARGLEVPLVRSSNARSFVGRGRFRSWLVDRTIPVRRSSCSRRHDRRRFDGHIPPRTVGAILHPGAMEKHDEELPTGIHARHVLESGRLVLLPVRLPCGAIRWSVPRRAWIRVMKSMLTYRVEIALAQWSSPEIRSSAASSGVSPLP